MPESLTALTPAMPAIVTVCFYVVMVIFLIRKLFPKDPYARQTRNVLPLVNVVLLAVAVVGLWTILPEGVKTSLNLPL